MFARFACQVPSQNLNGSV